MGSDSKARFVKTRSWGGLRQQRLKPSFSVWKELESQVIIPWESSPQTPGLGVGRGVHSDLPLIFAFRITGGVLVLKNALQVGGGHLQVGPKRQMGKLLLGVSMGHLSF